LGPSVEALLQAMRSAPEVFLSGVVVALSAARATREGLLPGSSHGLLGAAIQGVLWLCLYAGLGVAFRARALQIGKDGRPVFWKLGLALVLALISTSVCMRLLAPSLAPATWSHFFYLRFFAPPALVALWCAVLLPHETRILGRAVASDPVTVPLPQLAVLLASAAVLVSGADLPFHLGGSSAIEVRLRDDVIEPKAWLTNTMILFSAYALVFSLTRRLAAALLLVSPVYILLGLASLTKLKYMHSAVQPLDLLRIREFLPLCRSFFGTGGVIATVIGPLGLRSGGCA
jgi:hypothetical protein